MPSSVSERMRSWQGTSPPSPMVKAGDRYWAQTSTGTGATPDGHFFFVLVDPTGPDHTTLIVPHCTVRDGFVDPTCILRARNPAFLTSDSFVDYRFADTRSADDIDRELRAGRARMSGTIPGDLVQLICTGLLASPFTKRRVKIWYHELLLDTL
jgi:hypothetical protein